MRNSNVEWIGLIPNAWQVARVKNVFYRSQKKAQIIDPVVLSLARSGVKVRDITNNEGQLAESYYDYNPVKVGDLLLNPMDLYSGANCSYSKVNGVISPAYMNLRSYKKSDSRYYDYYFKCQYWAMTFFAHGKGVSFDNRWTLNNETLMNYYIPLPSFEEQTQIADFLDKKCSQINALISLEEKEIEKLKEYKQSKINAVVSKGLAKSNIMKESGIEWIGQFPTGWNITRLKYIGKFSGGISSLKPENFGFGYPFVNYKNIYKNYVLNQNIEEKANTTLEERKKYNIKYGDLFFTGSSETVDELGYSCVALNDFPDAVYNGFCIRMRPYSFVNYNPKYFLYLTRSHICRNYLSANDNSITRANLSQSRLGGMPIIFPNIKEQEKSVEYLDNLCQKIEDLILIKQSKIEELQTYKKSLIYEYVTGKKRCI